MFDCKDIDKIDNISLKKLLNLRCDRIANNKTLKIKNFKKNNYINVKLILLFLLIVFIIYIFKNKNKKQRK